MTDAKRSIPTWKAPDTLLPRVLAAVEDLQPTARAQGFFAWPSYRRLLFWCGVAGAFAAALISGPALSSLLEPMLLPLTWLVRLNEYIAAMSAVVSVLRGMFVPLILTHPLYFLLALLCAVATLATWTLSVAGLWTLLDNQRKRTYA